MLKPALQLRLGQQLTMTPQLQQAIRLLQLPALDLQQTIREALEQNVMLEAEEEGEADVSLEEAADAAPSPGNADGVADEAAEPEIDVSDDSWDDGRTAGAADSPWTGDDRPQEFSDQRGETLQEHLSWQLEMARLGPRELAIGRALIDAINDDGYLVDPLDDVAAVLRPELDVAHEEVERVLRAVQAFDPPGVAARSVSECIELQLGQLAPDTPGLATATEVARRHLDLVATQQYALLRKTLQVDEEELSRALALVRSCHPRPGSAIQPTQPDYIVPDVFVRRAQHGWVVELNAGALPRVRLNQGYASLVTRAAEHAVLRTHRGLELGTILCAAVPGHAHYLPNTTLGQLLRLADANDEEAAERMRQRSQLLFEDALRLPACQAFVHQFDGHAELFAHTLGETRRW